MNRSMQETLRSDPQHPLTSWKPRLSGCTREHSQTPRNIWWSCHHCRHYLWLFRFSVTLAFKVPDFSHLIGLHWESLPLLLGVRVFPIPVLGNGSLSLSTVIRRPVANWEVLICIPLTATIYPSTWPAVLCWVTSSFLWTARFLGCDGSGSGSKCTHFAENALPACSLVSHAYPIRTVFTLCYNSSFHLPALYYELFDNKVIHFPFLNPRRQTGGVSYGRR